jgi:hypothetical protein
MCLFISFSSRAQQTIHINLGTAVTIDGVKSTGEWTDADSIQIDLQDGREVVVKYKHDGASLLTLFYGPLFSYAAIPVFPEICLDIDHDAAAAWAADDWWFHVSAQDCESQGAIDDYNDCAPVQNDWEAAPNFVAGNQPDTVEISIPFSKILPNLTSGDTVGINFLVNNTNGLWRTWPADVDKQNPSTWADAVFNLTGSGVEQLEAQKTVTLYPNPTYDYVSIHSPNKSTINKVELLDNRGCVLMSEGANAISQPLFVGDHGSGMYLLRLTHNDGTMTIKRLTVLSEH